MQLPKSKVPNFMLKLFIDDKAKLFPALCRAAHLLTVGHDELFLAVAADAVAGLGGVDVGDFGVGKDILTFGELLYRYPVRIRRLRAARDASMPLLTFARNADRVLLFFLLGELLDGEHAGRVSEESGGGKS